ncbi:MAG: hypothetical protein A3F41_03775 [Coxiella sp. RIFCSPHIGHO2_12_FULL_44_14]|nr:MAG: hypothetical protein A3F41_03775 [Coxiella sp. RIFCSPHIGHO2_12_FULL_44_14]
MPISKINPKKKFDAAVWLISIVNTGDKLTGHALLVIEGIQYSHTTHQKLFVGQYDIVAKMDKTDPSMLNKKGYIASIRIFEQGRYGRQYEHFPSKTYSIDPIDAKLIIRSIKEDHVLCQQAAKGEIEYPKFQLVGDKHLFSKIGMGDNCASWCMKKLKAGGITIDALMSKPKKLVK